MRKTLATMTLAGVVATVPGCRSRRAPPPSPSAAASAVAAPLDLNGSIYGSPRRQHPVAVQLCDALHAFPGRRVAECCGTQPSRFVFDECVRVVSVSLEAGSVVLHPDRVEACARAEKDWLAGCEWVTPGEPLAAPACQSLFEGTIQEGGVCRSSLECTGNLHCEGLGTTRTGICKPPQDVGAGCGTHVDAMATYVLDRSLERSRPFCRDFCSLVNHRCEPLPPEGASCSASVNCAPGHACVAGRCSSSAPRISAAAPGESCKTDFDCKKGGCVKNGDGQLACGMKCSLSFDARSNAPAMRLPSRQADR